jgi:hypothetical protein
LALRPIDLNASAASVLPRCRSAIDFAKPLALCESWSIVTSAVSPAKASLDSVSVVMPDFCESFDSASAASSWSLTNDAMRIAV